MKKFEEIKKLEKDTYELVINDEQKYKDFLVVAGKFYRYNFRDALLIYAQRPEATACASFDIWSQKMHCWIHRGSKGIALLDHEAMPKRKKLRYIFDVKDVSPSKKIGRTPVLWKYNTAFEDAVYHKLENIYGSLGNSFGMLNRITELSYSIAEDMLDEESEFYNHLSGTIFDSMPQEELEERVKETLASSLAYSILSRFGLAQDILDNAYSFPYLKDFSNISVLYALGDMHSAALEPLLAEVGKTVFEEERKRLDSQKYVEASQAITKELNKNNTSTLSQMVDNQVAKDTLENENSTEYNQEQENNAMRGNAEGTDIVSERSENGDRIRESRGLHGAQRNAGGGAGRGIDEIRNDEIRILEGELPDNYNERVSFRHTVSALSRRAASSTRPDEIADFADGETRRSDRAVEERGSDGLGRTNEQYQGEGGGNGADGHRTQQGQSSDRKLEAFQLSLQDLFPSFEEQMGTITAAELSVETELPAAFHLSEKELLDIVRTGGGLESSKSMIFERYRKNKDADYMTDFIKNNIKTTGKGLEINGQRIAVWFDEKGMTISPGDSAFSDKSVSYSWTVYEQLTRSLIENGDYFTAEEDFASRIKELDRISDHIFFLYRDVVPSFSKVFEKTGTYPKTVKNIQEAILKNGINLVDEMKEIKQEVEAGKRTQSHWNLTIDDVIEELETYLLPNVSMEHKEDISVLNPSFITQDEINYVFVKKGSGFAQGNFRIYDQFNKGLDAKTNADFLKNEYGVGGSSHALPGSDHSWIDHDAKGITLTKGNLVSPFASITIT